MSRSNDWMTRLLWSLTILIGANAYASERYPGIGRPATEAEIRAWDIDVRPDFVGLPPGSGSVADGEKIWIEKCSSCHGDFADANHVFPPLIGNTTLQDIETGRVAALKEPGVNRTTIMKVPTVSTLWDFINRAMPWDRPKSLKTDEVYAVLAYLLSLADIVPADFVLNEKNIAWVQSRMPNRNGMTLDHGLWKIDGKPDTNNKACMRNCRKDVEVTSSLPDYAKAAHGELMKQNREYGSIRGTRTLPETEVEAAGDAVKAPTSLLTANGCLGCHGIEGKIVGPGFRQILEKHRGRSDLVDYLKGRIRNGGAGTWGEVAMPPMAQISDTDLDQIVRWIVDGSPQ